MVENIVVINSPITNSKNVVLRQKIDVDEIVKSYYSILGIDTSYLFDGLKSISLYECLDTGYRFYYPIQCSGDSGFYENLSKMPWYYSDWKWEYKVSIPFLRSGDKILEIGCGKGAFLKAAKKHVQEVEGIELNEKAPEYGKQIDVTIYNKTVEDLAKEFHGKYDVVLAFQVLEHIHDVKSFIESSLKILKTGGKLIFAVPNNDALFFKYKADFTQKDFYRDSQGDLLFMKTAKILNMPPHHFGMWNASSLKKLAPLFGLQIENIISEPASNGLIHTNIQLVWKKLKEQGMIYQGNKICRLAHLPIYYALKVIDKAGYHFRGHTILAVYKKT